MEKKSEDKVKKNGLKLNSKLFITTIVVILLLIVVIAIVINKNKDTNTSKNPKEAIIGEWTYYTGFTTWYFTFNKDGSCEHHSGNNYSEYSTYVVNDNQHIIVAGLENWVLYYKIEDNAFNIYHAVESGNDWKFVKSDKTLTDKKEYPNSLMLNDDMLNAIKAKITDKNYSTSIGWAFRFAIKDLKEANFDITNQKKETQYTYIVYGVLTGKDNYNQRIKQNVKIIYYCIENKSESTGYEIKMDTQLD